MSHVIDTNQQINEIAVETLVNARFPQRWFENLWISGTLICLFTIALHVYCFVPYFRLSPPLSVTMPTAIMYFVTTFLDLLTTRQGMQLKQAYEAHGLTFPIQESNFLLPNYVTFKHYCLSIPGLITVAGAVYLFFVPAVAVGASLLRLTASCVNTRVRHRAEYELELLDRETQSQVRETARGGR